MLNWLIFAVVGRVLIYVWMKFELPFKNKWIEKIHECPLCSGVWIYGALALAFRVDIFSETFITTTATIIGELVTAVITSFLVHYFILGWKSQHEVIVV